jgi:hypothetical protein
MRHLPTGAVHEHDGQRMANLLRNQMLHVHLSEHDGAVILFRTAG